MRKLYDYLTRFSVATRFIRLQMEMQSYDEVMVVDNFFVKRCEQMFRRISRNSVLALLD